MGSTRSGVGGKEHTHGAINYPPGIHVGATAPPAYRGREWWDTGGPEAVGVYVSRTITSSDTLTLLDEVIFVDASGGAVTVTLPTVADKTNKRYNIKKIDSSANAVTIDGDGSETIDDTTTRILSSQYDAVVIQNDGSEWWIL